MTTSETHVPPLPLKCKICFECEKSAVFSPCSHVCACLHCATQCNWYPICRVPILKIKKSFCKTFTLFWRAFSWERRGDLRCPTYNTKQQRSFKNRACRHNKPHDTLQYVSFIFRLVSTQTLGTRHFNSFQGMKCFQDALKLGLVVFIRQRLFCVDKLLIRRFVNNVD